MRQINWVDTAPSGGMSEQLPDGGYVLKIMGVKDDVAKEFLTITYDVAEGEHAGFYNDAWGQANAWAHQFNRWYGEQSEGSFSAFLHALEDSNPNRFHIANWQQAGCPVSMFEGCLIGAIMRKRIYTPTKGRNAGGTAEAIEVGRIVSANDIRTGNWKPLPPRDTRKQVEGQVAAVSAQQSEQPSYSVYDDSLPF